MSLKVFNDTIPAQIMMDPIINNQVNPKYTIEKGSSDSSVVQYVAQNVSTTACNFTVNTISDTSYLDRKLVAHWNMRFTVQGVPPAGSPVLFPGGIGDDGSNLVALRWMAIQNCTDNLRLQINGTSINFNPSVYLEPLDRYSGDPFADNLGLSIAPSKHDNSQDYTDSFNTNINPLSGYFSSNTPQGRSALSYTLASDNGATAVIDVSWAEPIIISPLLFQSKSGGDERGFIGLTSDVLVNFNFGDLTRMLSINEVDGPTINSVVPTFLSNPYITARWLTSPVPMDSLNDPQYYPYSQIDYFSTTNNQIVNAGASGRIVSNNITFIAIPSKILVVIRQLSSNRSWGDTDTYAVIDDIDINFNNKSGILTGSDNTDLYLRSVRNGLKDLSYQGWNRHVGSPLMLDFNKDIPIAPLDSVDMLGRYNFYISVNFRNTSQTNKTYELLLCPFFDGIFNIQAGLSSLTVGLVDKNSLKTSDIIEAQNYPETDFHNSSFFMEGGSFLNKAKKLGKNVANLYNKAKDFSQTPQFEQALSFAKKLGLGAAEAVKILGPMLLAAGYSDNELYDMMVYDGGYSPLEIKAAGLSGAGLTGGSSSNNFRKVQIRDPSTQSRTQILNRMANRNTNLKRRC